jgi:hypothetical protein
VGVEAEELAAIEAIKALKARYFRAMDTKDWPAFEAVFTADATMDVSGELGGGDDDAGIIRGNAAIRAFVQGAVDDVTTVHHGHMPEIEIVSPGRARGIWAMEDQLAWPEGAPIRSLHGFGHYHETYEQHDGRWLIASLRLTRLRVDVEIDDV